MMRMPSLPALGAAIVLAAASAASPAAGPLDQRLDRVVGRVDGSDIRAADVRDAVNRLLPLRSFHGGVPKDKVQELAREAMQEVINDRLKLADAKRRGIEVDEAGIDEAYAKTVSRYPSPEEFEARLKQSGLSEEDLREALRRRQMLKSVEAAVEAEAVDPTLDDARKFYDDNPQRFREPPRAEPRALLVKVPPVGRTEEMWMAAEEKAEAARRRITEGGESFADVADEFSEGAAKGRGGGLGAIHKGQLPPELDKPLWALSAGGVTPPVRSMRGVYLLGVDRFLPARKAPFEEQGEAIRTHLARSARREHVKKWVEGLRAEARVEYLEDYFSPEK